MDEDRQRRNAPLRRRIADQRYLRSMFLRNVTSTFGMNILLLLTSIANSAIIARVFGPDGKGILTLAVLLPSLLALLLGMGVGAANVFHAGARIIPLPSLSRNSVGIGLVVTAIGVGMIVVLLINRWLAVLLPGVPTQLALLALTMFPLGLFNGYLSGLLQGRQRIFTLNLIMTLQGVITLALTVLLVVGLRFGLTGGVLAYVLAAGLTLVLTSQAARQEGAHFTPAWQPEVLRPTLAYGLRGYVGNVLQFFNYRLDVFLVNSFLGSAGVGIYSAAVALAELLWQLPNAVSFVIFPKASATKATQMNRFTPRVFGVTLALTALGGAGLLMLGRFLIAGFYGAKFATAYEPMIALLPGVILLGGAKVLTNEIAGRGHPHYNSISSAIGLVLTLSLDLLLIPRYGVLGAAVASSIAYAAIFVAAVFFYLHVSRRQTGESLVF